MKWLQSWRPGGGWPAPLPRGWELCWHLAQLRGCTEHKHLKKERERKGKRCRHLENRNLTTHRPNREDQVSLHIASLCVTLSFLKKRGDFSDEPSDVTKKWSIALPRTVAPVLGPLGAEIRGRKSLVSNILLDDFLSCL